MAPIWLLALGLIVLGVSAMLGLFRMASDPVTRLRDPEGHEIDPAELESDEPPEMRAPPE